MCRVGRDVNQRARIVGLATVILAPCKAQIVPVESLTGERSVDSPGGDDLAGPVKLNCMPKLPETVTRHHACRGIK